METSFWSPRKSKKETKANSNSNKILKGNPKQNVSKAPSSTFFIPPTKKARLVNSGASSIQVEYVTSIPKLSSEMLAPSDHWESQESLQSRWPSDSEIEFPSITGIDTVPLKLAHNINHMRHYDPDTAPVYSISGTQRLTDVDEPFNLKLEFPIPKHYHVYKSKLWRKSLGKGTSLTDSKVTRGAKDSSTVVTKGTKSSIIATFKPKAAVFRLKGRIPLVVDRLHLFNDKEDSCEEEQSFEMYELTRGHPPTKKIKVEESQGSSDKIMNSLVQHDSNTRISEHNLRNQEFLLKNQTSPFDFLYIDKRLAQNRRTSKGALPAVSSSETDDEMKYIENDHPDMTAWEYPGLSLTEPESHKQNIQKGSLKKPSVKKITNALKSCLSSPFRLMRSSKVWPENKQVGKLKSTRKMGQLSENDFSKNNTANFHSFNSLGSNQTHNKSLDVVSHGQYQNLELTTDNQPLEVDESRVYNSEKSVRVVETETNQVDKSSVRIPVDAGDRKTDPVDSIVVSRSPTSIEKEERVIEKGSNESTNAKKISKTKSLLPVLNGVSGLLSEEKNNDETTKSLSNTIGPSVNFSRDKEGCQKFNSEPNEVIVANDPAPMSGNDTKGTIKTQKKVSFLRTIWEFFHRKDDPNRLNITTIQQPIRDDKDYTKRKTFLQKLGFKARKVEREPAPDKVDKAPSTLLLPPTPDTDDEVNRLINKLPNHKNSVSIIRKKRMKLFEETREFYEDSILAYRNVLVSKGVGSQPPLDTSFLAIPPVNAFSRLASTNLLQGEPSLSMKCTVSESVILPVISRRKHRLNQFFPDELINEVSDSVNINVIQNSFTKQPQPRKGILKNPNP